MSDASPDLMRHLLTVVINALLSAEADAVCVAEYGVASPDRVNSRNGYRHRDLDTRAGTVDLAIPKLRTGTYFPEWLLERRKRAEAALISVVATCYLLGVSTRRMDKLVQALGIDGLSKAQVSRMAQDAKPGRDARRERVARTTLCRPGFRNARNRNMLGDSQQWPARSPAIISARPSRHPRGSSNR
jgi:transposase-like protein